MENLRVRFHLKINTGMNRLGIGADEVESFREGLWLGCKHIELEGTFTHFASAEDFTAQQTNEQEKVFLACLARLRARWAFRPGLCTWQTAERFARGRTRGRIWFVLERFFTGITSRLTRRRKNRK